MPPETGNPDPRPARNFRIIKTVGVDGASLGTRSAGSVAQIVLAIAAVLAICYVAKLPLIVLLVSILLAFMLAPLVDLMQRWRIPRWAGSFVAVTLLIACLYSAAYLSYTRAAEFIEQLPRYTENIRKATVRFRKQAEKIQQSTVQMLPSADSNDPNAVTVREDSAISTWIADRFSSITEIILTFSFVPFLVYFMLSWRDRTRNATLKLFDPKNRHKVGVTLIGIAEMMRGFLVGNFICGLFMAAVSAAVFAFLQLPYFYFLGLISGFLSLVPYLGVVLAMIPPLAAGIGQIGSTELVTIAVLVIVLHVFSINILFPKVIGKRLKLNPLVVTIALLIWGWLWGAMGLVLAVPITGSLKIIFDHIDSLKPFGAWMED